MKGTIMNPEKREDPKNPKGVKNPHILVALCLNQKKVSVIVPFEWSHFYVLKEDILLARTDISKATSLLQVPVNIVTFYL